MKNIENKLEGKDYVSPVRAAVDDDDDESESESEEVDESRVPDQMKSPSKPPVVTSWAKIVNPKEKNELNK